MNKYKAGSLLDLYKQKQETWAKRPAYKDPYSQQEYGSSPAVRQQQPVQEIQQREPVRAEAPQVARQEIEPQKTSFGDKLSIAADTMRGMPEAGAKVMTAIGEYPGQLAGKALGGATGFVSGFAAEGMKEDVARMSPQDRFKARTAAGVESAKRTAEFGGDVFGGVTGGLTGFVPHLLDRVVDVGEAGVNTIRGKEDDIIDYTADEFLKIYNADIDGFGGFLGLRPGTKISKEQAKNYLKTGDFDGKEGEKDMSEMAKAWLGSLTATGIDLFFAGQIAKGALKNVFKGKKLTVVGEAVDAEAAAAALKELGLKRGASKKQVKEAWENQRRELHPDRQMQKSPKKQSSIAEEYKKNDAAYKYLRKEYHPEVKDTTMGATPQNSVHIDNLRTLGLEWGATRKAIAERFKLLKSQGKVTETEINAKFNLLQGKRQYMAGRERFEAESKAAAERKKATTISKRAQAIEKQKEAAKRMAKTTIPLETAYPTRGKQLPAGTGRTEVSPIESPDADFQIIDTKKQSLLTGLKTKLENLKNKKQGIIDSGRGGTAVKTEASKLQTTIDNITQKIEQVRPTVIKTTGPISKVTQGQAAAIPKPASVPVKTKTIAETVKGVKAAKVAKDTITAIKKMEPKKTFVKKKKPETPIKTVEKEVKPKEKVRAAKAYKDIATNVAKQKAKPVSSAVSRLLGNRKRADVRKAGTPVGKTKTVSRASVTPKSKNKDVQAKIADMTRKGASENDFRKLSFKYYEDYLSGKAKTDKSADVDKHIDSKYGSNTERLYSRKAGGTIDRAEARKTTTTKKFKLYEKTKELVNKYGKLVSEKNVGRRSAGVHYKNTGNIGVKALNDVPTVVHELAHRLDTVSGITDAVIKAGDRRILAELKKIFLEHYAGANNKASSTTMTREGFSTFIERYSLDPAEIGAAYPELVKAFIHKNGKYYNGDISRLVADIDKLAADYQALTAGERIASRVATDIEVVEPKYKQITKDRIREELTDYVFPLERFAMNKGNHFKDNDVSVIFRHRKNVRNLALRNITETDGFWTIDKDGNPYKKFDFNPKTLGQDLVKNGDYSAYVEEYLPARRVYFEAKELKDLESKADLSDTETSRLTQLKETNKNEDWNMADIDEVYNTYTKDFAKYDKQFDAINREYIKLERDAGIISEEFAKEMLGRKGYSAMQRIAQDDMVTSLSRNGSGSKIKKIAQKLGRKGSKKTIIDPFISFVRNGMNVFDRVMLHKTYKELRAQEDGTMVQGIETEPVPVGKGIMYPDRDGNIVTFRDKDKMVSMKVNSDLRRVFETDADIMSNGSIERAMRIFPRYFVKFTTGAYRPAFLFKNLLIDSPAVMAQTRNSIIPIASGMKAITKAKMDKTSLEAKTFAEWQALSGRTQAQINMYNDNPEQVARSIGIKQIVRGRLKEELTKIDDWVAKPSEYAEIVNRYGEYHASRARGNSVAVAMEEAARVSASFIHKGRMFGKTGRNMMSMVPYGNSPGQVTDTAIKGITDPVTRARAISMHFLMAAMSVGGFMSLLSNLKSAMLSGDEDKIEEAKALVNDYKNLNTYELGNNLIAVNTMSSSDTRKLNKLRTPGDYNIIGTLATMAMAESLLGREFSYADYIDAAKDPLVPALFDVSKPADMFFSWLPQPMKAITTVTAGIKTFPDIRDIEPVWMSRRDSQDRYYPYTNQLAIHLGQTEVMKDKGISPLQIEEFMKQMAGPGGQNLTKYIDEGIPGALKAEWEDIKRVFVNESYQFSGTGYQQFYDDKTTTNNAYSRAKKDGDKDSEDELKDHNKLYNSVGKNMNDLRKINEATDSKIPARISNQLYEVIDLLNKNKKEEAIKLYDKNDNEINRFIKKENRKIK